MPDARSARNRSLRATRALTSFVIALSGCAAPRPFLLLEIHSPTRITHHRETASESAGASVPDENRPPLRGASLAPENRLCLIEGDALLSRPIDSEAPATRLVSLDGPRALAAIPSPGALAAAIPSPGALAVVVVPERGRCGVALFDDRLREIGFIDFTFDDPVAAGPRGPDDAPAALDAASRRFAARVGAHDRCFASLSPDGALLAVSFAPRDLGQFVPLTRIVDLERRLALPLEGFSHVHFVGPRRVVAQRAGRPGDFVFGDLALGDRAARLRNLSWGPALRGREIVASDPAAGLFAIRRDAPLSTDRFVDVYDAGGRRLGGTRAPVEWTAEFILTTPR